MMQEVATRICVEASTVGGRRERGGLRGVAGRWLWCRSCVLFWPILQLSPPPPLFLLTLAASYRRRERPATRQLRVPSQFCCSVASTTPPRSRVPPPCGRACGRRRWVWGGPRTPLCVACALSAGVLKVSAAASTAAALSTEMPRPTASAAERCRGEGWQWCGGGRGCGCGV